jgi:hypothetical protein
MKRSITAFEHSSANFRLHCELSIVYGEYSTVLLHRFEFRADEQLSLRGENRFGYESLKDASYNAEAHCYANKPGHDAQRSG